MNVQSLITAVAVTVAVLSLLYALIGKKDTVMTKLIESKIETVNAKLTTLATAEELRAARADIARVEAKVDQLLNKIGS